MPCVKYVFSFPLLRKHHSAFVAPLSAIKVTGMVLSAYKVLLKNGAK